jgi:hypothetical protein
MQLLPTDGLRLAIISPDLIGKSGRVKICHYRR